MKHILTYKLYEKTDLKSEFSNIPNGTFVHFGSGPLSNVKIEMRYAVAFRDEDPTPVGLYFYPIEILKERMKQSSKSLVFDNMYRGSGQVLSVVKLKGNIITDENQKYDNKKLSDIESKLNAKFKEAGGKSRKTVVTDFDKMYSQMTDDELEKSMEDVWGSSRSTQRYLANNNHLPKKSPAASVYYRIMAIAEKNAILSPSYNLKQPQLTFTEICKEIGIDGFVDSGHGYIYPGADREKSQAVIFNESSIEPKFFIYKKENKIEKV